MFKAIYAEIVQEDDIVLCRGSGNYIVLSLTCKTAAFSLSFRATAVGAYVIGSVFHENSAYGVHQRRDVLNEKPRKNDEMSEDFGRFLIKKVAVPDFFYGMGLHNRKNQPATES